MLRKTKSIISNQSCHTNKPLCKLWFSSSRLLIRETSSPWSATLLLLCTEKCYLRQGFNKKKPKASVLSANSGLPRIPKVNTQNTASVHLSSIYSRKLQMEPDRNASDKQLLGLQHSTQKYINSDKRLNSKSQTEAGVSARCFQGHMRLCTYNLGLLAQGRFTRSSVTQCSLQLVGRNEGISSMKSEGRGKRKFWRTAAAEGVWNKANRATKDTL